MDIIEVIKLSLSNLMNFKFRTFLTMLGIIMGIMSVVLISSIGAGFEDSLLSNLKSTTASLLNVSINPKYLKNGDYTVDDLFTKNDTIKLERIEGIEYAEIDANIVGLEKETNIYTYVVGIKNFDILKTKFIKGRAFTESELKNSDNVIVIDSKVANSLFPNKNPIGEYFTLKDFNDDIIGKYIIVGVVEPLVDNTLIDSLQKIYYAYLPLNTIFNINNNLERTSTSISVQVKDVEQINNVKLKLERYLRTLNKKADFYEVKNASSELNQIQDILNKISLFISLIASISIIVGGVGVMNIMLVSVKERINEIGLRKAIGAKNKDIMLQFLLETVIITLIGGIVGVILGYSIAFIIGLFINVTPILSMKTLIVSAVVSSLVGILFGIYPARQASKLSPIEALVVQQ